LSETLLSTMIPYTGTSLKLTLMYMGFKWWLIVNVDLENMSPRSCLTTTFD
jgi:hypothetical protein